MEKIGLKAIIDTKEFTSGLATFLSGIDKAKRASLQAASSQGKSVAAGAELASMLGTVGMAAGGIAAVAFGTLAIAVAGAAKAFSELVIEGLPLADNLQRLALTTEYLALATGRSNEQFQKEIDALTKLDLKTSTALELMQTFYRYGWDVSKATDLVKLSMDAAALTGEHFDDVVIKMTEAIETLRTRSLKQMGIVIPNIEKEYENWAATIGKTKDELTLTDKQAALLNATLREGQRITGVYGVVAETAAMQQLELREEVDKLRTAISGPFVEAQAEVIGLLRDFVRWLLEATSAGGALYPTLVALGAIADWLAEKIRVLLNITLASIGREMITQLPDTAEKAAAQVVQESVNAIQEVVQEAVKEIAIPEYIEQQVSLGWGDLGLQAASAWLEGFTSVDFSILDTAQSAIERALDIMVAAGLTTAEAAARTMADTLQIIMAELSGEGAPSATFFSAITAATGEFGDEITRLIELQYSLAQATEVVEAAEKKLDDENEKVSEAEEILAGKVDAVTEAEEKLAEAREKEQDAQGNINAEIYKYNKMLREGAAPALLAAQREKVDAAFAAQEAAQQEIETAEQSVTVAEEAREKAEAEVKLAEQKQSEAEAYLRLMQEQRDMAQEQYNWQEKLVGAMTAAAQSQIDYAQQIVDAQNAAQKEMIESLQEAKKLAEETGTGDLEEAMDVPELQPVTEPISTQLQEDIALVKDKVNKAFNDPEFWAAVWQGMKDKFKTDFGNFCQFVANAFLEFIHWDEITAWWRSIFDPEEAEAYRESNRQKIIAWWEGIKTGLSTWIEDIKRKIETWRDDMTKKMGELEKNINDSIRRWVTNTIATITSWITNIKTKFDDWKDALFKKFEDFAVETKNKLLGFNWWEIGRSIVQGIAEGITGAADWIIAAVQSMGETALAAIRAILGIYSPSKRFKEEIGWNIGAGIQEGIIESLGGLRSNLGGIVNGMVLRPAVSAAGVATSAALSQARTSISTSNNMTSNVNFGGVAINNGIDLATFKAMTTSAIKQALSH